MSTPINERRYTIMCDSPKHPGLLLAHIDRSWYGRVIGYWTSTTLEHVGSYTLEEATTILQSLSYNNPRIVRLKKAITIVALQRCSRTLGAPTAHETVQAARDAQAYFDLHATAAA